MIAGTGNTRPGSADSTEPLIRTERRNNVLIATIDVPGKTMNVISWAMMDALEKLIEQLRDDPAVECAVVTSGKPTFLAGADLQMVRGFTDLPGRADRAEVHEITGRLGRLFVSLEAVPKPTVAAINGLALGGGLELALACAYRIVAGDSRIQLGLPEVKFGLLPGAGGTQRLPRLVGIEKGTEMLLSGRSVDPSEALQIGLVDEIVPGNQLIERAVSIATEAARSGKRPRLAQRLDPGPFDLDKADAARLLSDHFGYSPEITARYPAYTAIVRAVIEGAKLPVGQGDEIETSRFVDLMFDPAKTAASMVSTLFLNRQLADKATAAEAALPAHSGIHIAGESPAAARLQTAVQAAGLKLDSPERARIVVIAAERQRQGNAGLVLLNGPEDILLEGRTGICLFESTPLGRTLEIVAPERDEAGRGLALSLAKSLRATPYCHGGARSVLLNLNAVSAAAKRAGLDEDGVLLAQALAAEGHRSAGMIDDTRFADVACVIAGIVPPWSGGPFTHLALLGESGVSRLKARYTAAAPHLFS